MTDEEKIENSQRILRLIEQTKTSWMNLQENKIDNFISEIKYRDVKMALDELKEKQLNGWNDNPFWEKAEKFVLKKVIDDINNQWHNFDYSQKAYLRMKELCAKVRNTQSQLIKKSECYIFANKYCEWLDSNPTNSIKISKIEGYSTYPDGAYIYNCEYSYGDKNSPWRPYISRNEKIFKNIWTTLPGSWELNIEVKPWEDFWMSFEPWKNIEWGLDEEKTGMTIRISPGLSKNTMFYKGRDKSEYSEKQKYGDYIDVSCGEYIVLRIYYYITGKNLEEMLKESGLLK